jgi:DNA-binding GntR family transcriptional regulator
MPTSDPADAPTLLWPGADSADPTGNPSYWRFFEALLDGRLRLGQTITQDDLCRILDTSLSPLRETVTLLAAEGLVHVRRRVGVTIFYPDVAFVRSTFQFRGLIEREGVRKLAVTADPDWIDALEARHRRVMAEVERVPSPSSYAAEVRKIEHVLHGTIAASFGNLLIREVHDRLTRKLILLRLLNPSSANAEATIASLTEHLRILDALRRRDPDEAAVALERHLGGVIHRTLVT